MFCDFVQGAHIQEAASVEARSCLGAVCTSQAVQQGLQKNKTIHGGNRDPNPCQDGSMVKQSHGGTLCSCKTQARRVKLTHTHTPPG